MHSTPQTQIGKHVWERHLATQRSSGTSIGGLIRMRMVHIRFAMQIQEGGSSRRSMNHSRKASVQHLQRATKNQTKHGGLRRSRFLLNITNTELDGTCCCWVCEGLIQHMLETFYNDPFHKLGEGTLSPEVFKFFASVWPSNVGDFYQVKSGLDKRFLALILHRP